MKSIEVKRLMLSACLMSIIMSGVLSLFWTLNSMSLFHDLIEPLTLLTAWGEAWFMSFIVACPVSLIFAPIIKNLTSNLLKSQ